MKTIFLTLLIGWFPLILGAQDHFEEYRKQFVGTWKVERDQRVTKVTWHADGTWESETVDNGNMLWKLSGVWWTKDDKLHGVCITSTDPAIPRGEDEASHVVEVTKEFYIIKNWRGLEKKYTRVKEKGYQAHGEQRLTRSEIR